jgi:hypothetical protein
VRVDIQVRFNGVDWGTLKIDVIDGKIAEVEQVSNVAIERFGLPRAGTVACLSRQYQIAEWIHAVTRPETEGERRNRARNIVDLYLFDTLAPTDDSLVQAACIEIFEREGAHEWPPSIDFPVDWSATIAELVAHVTTYIERLTERTHDIPI